MYQQQLEELQEKLNALAIDNEQLAMQNDRLIQKVQVVESEKEEIIMAHTEETSNLRRKINILRAVQSPPQPQPQPHITAWQPGFDPHEMPPDDLWNTFTSINDIYDEDDDEMMDVPMQQPEPRPQPVSGHETTLVLGRPRKEVNSVADTLGITTGAVLLFLLYGAYLGSSTSSSNRLPPMPDQYRPEADKILKDVFGKDGVNSVLAQQQVRIFDVRNTVPATWIQPVDMNNNYQNKLLDPMSSGFLSGVPAPNPTSSLDTLTTQLLTPSQEQEIEAAFSLTPAKYNHVTMQDVVSDSNDDEDSCPTPVPSYQQAYRETLKRAREDPEDESIPMVYKRSLMWEKVHPEVLKQFRALIREHPVKMEPDEQHAAAGSSESHNAVGNDE
jgi:hypothetical protein